jgi:allantoin racemase
VGDPVRNLKILSIEPWSWVENPQPAPSPMQKWARPDVEVHVIGVDVNKGRAFNELMSDSEWRESSSTEYTAHGIYNDTFPPDTSLSALNCTIEMMVYAEAHGYDAAFVSCFADPGVRRGRSFVNIPLVGACEASLHLASMLGHSFSIIVNFPIGIPVVLEKARLHGIVDRIKSVRAVDMATVERSGYYTRGHPEENRKRLLEEARKAVEVDGADAIVGGCTSGGWAELGLQEELGVPVVDAAVATLKVAEMMADLYHNFGTSHSRVGYYFPRGTFFG